MGYDKPISPILAQTMNIKVSQPKKDETKNVVQQQQNYNYSPLLIQTILAQSKQILPAKPVSGVVGVTEAHRAVSGYKNDLKTSLVSNKAHIIAVIP